MKKSIPPAAIVAIIIAAVAIVGLLGYKFISGGPDADVSQSRVNFYKNMKGPVGAGGNASPGGAQSGNNTTH